MIMSFLKDYAYELIGLGVGTSLSISFILLIKSTREVLQLLKELPIIDINSSSVNEARKIFNSAIGIRGYVLPDDEPLVSLENSRNVGVIYKHTIKEHLMAQIAGLWMKEEKILDETYTTIPFSIADNNIRIKVSFPDQLDDVDLRVVSEKFEAVNSSLADYFMGWVQGIRPTGLKYTEEMLLAGTKVLGIGQLVAEKDSLFLKRFSSLPYIITTKDKSSVMKDIESSIPLLKIFAFLWTSVSLYCLYRLLRKASKTWCEYRHLESQKRIVEEAKSDGSRELPESLTCLVCSTQLRDVVLLPCKHVCVCGSCSLKLSPRICPVCRANIETVQAVFYS